MLGVVRAAQFLALSLERPYEKLQPLEEEPFDLIVVLGGGTTEGRNGRAETQGSGDRVVLAARMYHAGLAKRIVCTGSIIGAKGAGNRLTPAEETAEILNGLGVPVENIGQIGGVNTMHETRNLADTIQPGERVGLVTDFITDLQIYATPLDLIPNSQAAAVTSSLLREYLARVVGR
jgi:uncharacterized SAM-binding protein YcdF (DUF218 family)